MAVSRGKGRDGPPSCLDASWLRTGTWIPVSVLRAARRPARHVAIAAGRSAAHNGPIFGAGRPRCRRQRDRGGREPRRERCVRQRNSGGAFGGYFGWAEAVPTTVEELS